VKKFFAALLVIILVIAIVYIIWNFVPVSNGLVFDLRQRKTPPNPDELFFDDLSAIGNGTYSVIFCKAKEIGGKKSFKVRRLTRMQYKQ